MPDKEIAIILAGCGNYDGTDVHEAAAAAVAIEKAGYTPTFYSLDKEQAEVIDHLVPGPARNCSGDPDDKPCRRNMLVESGRIARGRPSCIQELDVEGVSGGIIPGGGGVLKNTSNVIQFFRKEVEELKVVDELDGVLKGLHAAGKPIGVIAHAILLPAIVLDNQDLRLSFGGESDESRGFIQIAQSTGAQVEDSTAGVFVDEANHVISSPGFLNPSRSFLQVHEDMNRMVEEMVRTIHTP